MKTLLKRNIFFLVILNLFIALFAVSCEDKEEVVLEGDIAGFIGFYEAGYINYVDSLEGVEVILSGEGMEYKTYSTRNGHYEFKNIKGGLYYLVLKKEGYSFAHYFYDELQINTEIKITHLGGAPTIYNSYMAEIPTITLQLTGYEWIEDNIRIMGKLSKLQDFYTFSLFLGESNAVSPKESFSWIATRDDNKENLTIDRDNFIFDIKANSEDMPEKFFLIAYPTNIFSFFGDNIVGKPSNVIEIIKPD